MNLDEYWAEHGEPKVDLTDAVRADLVAYRNSRKRVLELSSLAIEMGCISGFFRYAVAMNWMPSDPVPRWAGRNMLMPRTRKRRIAKFLRAEQTRHFLDVGLRGDGADPEFAPAYPERDYCYGLLLASTGLRREECAFSPPRASQPSLPQRFGVCVGRRTASSTPLSRPTRRIRTPA